MFERREFYFSPTAGAPPPAADPPWAEIHARFGLLADSDVVREYALRLPTQLGAHDHDAFYPLEATWSDYLRVAEVSRRTRVEVRAYFAPLFTEFEGLAARCLGDLRIRVEDPRSLSVLLHTSFRPYARRDGMELISPYVILELCAGDQKPLLLREFRCRAQDTDVELTPAYVGEGRSEPWSSALDHLSARFDESLSDFVYQAKNGLGSLEDTLIWANR